MSSRKTNLLVSSLIFLSLINSATVLEIEGKYFKIRSTSSDLVLDIVPHPSGVKVQLEPSGPEATQHWYRDTITGLLKNRINQWCLETVKGIPYVKFCYPDQPDQRWTYDDQTQQIKHQLRRSVLARSSETEGATDVLWEASSVVGDISQTWVLDYDAVPITYLTIRNMASSGYLQVKGPKKLVIVKGNPDNSTTEDELLWYEDRRGNIRHKIYHMPIKVQGLTVRLQECEADGKCSSDSYWIRQDPKIMNHGNQHEVLTQPSIKSYYVTAYEYYGSSNQHWDMKELDLLSTQY